MATRSFTISPDIHPLTHTFTHRRQPGREPARLVQGHLDTQLGAGVGTSNLLVYQPTRSNLLSHMSPLGGVAVVWARTKLLPMFALNKRMCSQSAFLVPVAQSGIAALLQHRASNGKSMLRMDRIDVWVSLPSMTLILNGHTVKRVCDLQTVYNPSGANEIHFSRRLVPRKEL